MQVADWVLAGLAGWTGLGAIGTLLSLVTGERRKAWRGVAWMAGVWGVYLAVLAGASRLQRQRILEAGQEECFGTMCYAAIGVAAVGEFKGAGGGKVMTVSVRMRNRGVDGAAVSGISAYVVDGQGRRWGQTAGLGGVGLGAQVPARGETVSTPVFRVEGDAAGLGLILTRGWTGWGWLRIGDTDSLWHRPTMLRLP